MQTKRIKDNTGSKKLCVLNFEESQEIFGTFYNNNLEEEFKTRTLRCELRGIEFQPQKKQLPINQETLDLLEKQYRYFESVFYLFKDIYESIKKICMPRSFSTPYYIEELEYPEKEYTFVFNDENPGIEGANEYTLDNYQNFTGLYEYPRKMFKINDSIMRSTLHELIDIELLKAEGYFRDEVAHDNLFGRILNDSLYNNFQNNYFNLAKQAYLDYDFVKRSVEANNYIDEKLKMYASEYFILKNLHFQGSLFNREDFHIDRVIVTKKGVYIASLINYGTKGQTIQITEDNLWTLLSEDEQVIDRISNPTETNSLNCIAMRQILRGVLGDEADNIPVTPLIIVCNDDVRVSNGSHNQVIRGNELYLVVEKGNKSYDESKQQQIATSIFQYNTDTVESREFDTYIGDLESVSVVYEDVYYNHINMYLPRFVELLWNVKRKDYYQSNIRNKKISMITFILSGILILAGLILNTVLNPFNGNYGIPYICSCLTLILFSAAYFDYKFLQSWIEGEKTDECFEVRKSIFALGGFFSLLIISGVMTFALTTLQQII